MILSDNETKVDLLNNEAIASTIVGLLRERPESPVTVGVHGDWGAGKSSVLEMIEVALKGHEGVLCIKFNGWRFQGFEDAKVALIQGIVAELIANRTLSARAQEAVKDVLQRIDWLKLAKHAGGLAITTLTGVPAVGQIQAVVGTLEGLFSDPADFVTKENLRTAVDEAKSLLKPGADHKNVPEEIAAFRKAFDGLLKEAGITQLVVLIDDLDRCLPKTAIETLEAMRLFVFTSRTAFVVGADEAMIEYAVREHFPDLPETTGPQTYARNYLEKLIQVPFRIPALGETETRIYVTLLLVGAELGEDDPAFIRLIAAAREKLKRPWVGGVLDAAMTRVALGDKAAKAQNALTLSDQIGPILAGGTKGNPRQIKRFLNSLVLRQRTAQARGFEDDVKLPVLAKLMLAERFLPRVFDQIASSAASALDGACSDLAELERRTSDERTPSKAPGAKSEGAGKKSKSDVSSPPDSAQLGEWLSSPAVGSWSQVQPPLGAIDLRPYLFVTKDRKDYFGATSVLGHLAAVAEQLLGSRFSVQALEPELKRLAVPEAAQVFELVRGRIVGGDTFDTEPAGAVGLAVLARSHLTLQSSLLDLLEALPRSRLGPWVCSGWEGAIKDAEIVQRFDQMLEAWSKEGGTALKAAASATLRTRRGNR